MGDGVAYYEEVLFVRVAGASIGRCHCVARMEPKAGIRGGGPGSYCCGVKRLRRGCLHTGGARSTVLSFGSPASAAPKKVPKEKATPATAFAPRIPCASREGRLATGTRATPSNTPSPKPRPSLRCSALPKGRQVKSNVNPANRLRARMVYLAHHLIIPDLGGNPAMLLAHVHPALFASTLTQTPDAASAPASAPVEIR